MSRFEERLWGDLQRLQAAALPAPARTQHRHRRWVLPAGALAAAGAAALAAGALLGGGGAAPAFAIARSPGGVVTVTIRELEGATAANAALARMNLPVAVAKVEEGCAPPAGVATVPASLAAPVRGDTVEIAPSSIPAGQTLLITAQQGQHGVMVGYTLLRGAAPPCVPLARQVIPQRIR